MSRLDSGSDAMYHVFSGAHTRPTHPTHVRHATHDARTTCVCPTLSPHTADSARQQRHAPCALVPSHESDEGVLKTLQGTQGTCPIRMRCVVEHGFEIVRCGEDEERSDHGRSHRSTISARQVDLAARGVFCRDRRIGAHVMCGT